MHDVTFIHTMYVGNPFSLTTRWWNFDTDDSPYVSVLVHVHVYRGAINYILPVSIQILFSSDSCWLAVPTCKWSHISVCTKWYLSTTCQSMCWLDASVCTRKHGTHPHSHMQWLEIGQHFTGFQWEQQNCWLWHVQGECSWRRHCWNILWHSWLHRSWGIYMYLQSHTECVVVTGRKWTLFRFNQLHT